LEIGTRHLIFMEEGWGGERGVGKGTNRRERKGTAKAERGRRGAKRGAGIGWRPMSRLKARKDLASSNQISLARVGKGGRRLSLDTVTHRRGGTGLVGCVFMPGEKTGGAVSEGVEVVFSYWGVSNPR